MFSIVIPVYKNEESIPELLSALTEVSAAMEGGLGCRVEVVFVVDASPDRSYELLSHALKRAPFSSKLIVHSRNFGSFAAIRTGLAAASGDHFGVMAADLQEPPELMVEFLRALGGGDCDVVVGCREKRGDALPTRLAAAAFWRAYRSLVVPEIPAGGVDVFGCNRRFRDELLRLEESNSSLVGLVFWLGFRRKEIEYERRARKHGKSAWTLRKKLKYLFDSIFSFTDLPIRVLVAFGLLGLFGSAALGLLILVARFVGDISVPGYAATVLTILFFGGLNAVGLGIVGTYAWRGFENTKRRPLAVVLNCESFSGESGATVVSRKESEATK